MHTSSSFPRGNQHLQERVEIGAIRKNASPKASAVVLVWKKDGELKILN